jgi:D-galactose 1-dehydrogenase
MSIDGTPAELTTVGEYPGLYAHFARLIREGRSDVDLAPLRLVEEAFHCARRIELAPFIE